MHTTLKRNPGTRLRAPSATAASTAAAPPAATAATPTTNLRKQPDPLMPFVFPTALADGQRMGRGVIRLVTTASINGDVTIAHKLGRIPALILPLDNGTNYLPSWRRSTATAWTTTSVTVQFSVACNAPGLFVWLV